VGRGGARAAPGHRPERELRVRPGAARGLPHGRGARRPPSGGVTGPRRQCAALPVRGLRGTSSGALVPPGRPRSGRPRTHDVVLALARPGRAGRGCALAREGVVRARPPEDRGSSGRHHRAVEGLLRTDPASLLRSRFRPSEGYAPMPLGAADGWRVAVNCRRSRANERDAPPAAATGAGRTRTPTHGGRRADVGGRPSHPILPRPYRARSRRDAEPRGGRSWPRSRAASRTSGANPASSSSVSPPRAAMALTRRCAVDRRRSSNATAIACTLRRCRPSRSENGIGRVSCARRVVPMSSDYALPMSPIIPALVPPRDFRSASTPERRVASRGAALPSGTSSVSTRTTPSWARPVTHLARDSTH
jgi:hypothetical protein